MILYRVQFARPRGGWYVLWTTTAPKANKEGEQRAPAHVDVLELPGGKESLVELLNIASANRETLAQAFPMRLLKRWPKR